MQDLSTTSICTRFAIISADKASFCSPRETFWDATNELAFFLLDVQ